jgi:hypothetical protein
LWPPRSRRSAAPAAAYRPFDGTDAAVADFSRIEIEFQPLGRLRESGQATLIGPAAVFNYGVAQDWEAVLQGQAETPLPADRPTRFDATGAFLKHVIQPGALQDEPGPSIATEFGPLLPGVDADRGVGFSWAGILSQRWDWGTAHFNVEADLTRDRRAEAFLDVIVEGPSGWKVRPVAEFCYDRVFARTQTQSALVGAIWQPQDHLAFDAAFRYAFVDGRRVNEIRAGLTFAFDTSGDRRRARRYRSLTDRGRKKSGRRREFDSGFSRMSLIWLRRVARFL